MLFQGQEISKIEELLRKIVNKPFSEARSAIEERIDELLETHDKELSPETREILVIGYYRAAQVYSVAKPRRLGGPYFLHPEQTVNVLIGVGVSDPVTLLAGLFHDAVEEQLSPFYKELQKTKKIVHLKRGREDKKIGDTCNTIHTMLYGDLAALQISDAKKIAEQVCETVNLLTRRKTERYYGAIDRFFNPLQLRFPENQQRAIIIKFADRLANTIDLVRADYTTFPAEIRHQEILDAYDQNDTVKIRHLKTKAKRHARDHPPKTNGKFRGDQKLHPCFKNIIVLNQYREWVLAGNAAIPEVEEMGLAKKTEDTTEKIIDHLCTYHAANTVLNPRRVYDLYTEHRAYEQSGGYERVTQPRSEKVEGYDGIVQRFFDAKIRGNTRALAPLYKDRSLMLRAAIAFNHLSNRYCTDPEFHLHGLTARGIEPEPPIIHAK